MQTNFSPSTNIIRDSHHEIDYIVTNNSKEVSQEIINNYNSGRKFINLIGSYGTGKSSFLWALRQNLINKKNYFFQLNGQFNNLSKFNFLQVVGSGNSLSKELNKLFKKEKIKEDDLIENLDVYYKKYCQDKFLFIIIDEFGKFLEHASKNNPEKELYVIQQLAEYVNDKNKNIIIISTLHQEFGAYAKGLTKTQRLEWEKVKGRTKEVPFNEPVEQLIEISANYIEENFSFKKDQKNIQRINELVVKSKLTTIATPNKETINNIYPFDCLSISVLILSLQRYGQNERSLFSFLSSNDKHNLNTTELTTPFFSLDLVYNYLNYNFFNLLTSKYNPDYEKWNTIKSSIHKIENSFTKNIDDYIKIIKVIGLLNIFGESSERSKTFLSEYLNLSIGFKKSNKLIDELESKKIIIYSKLIGQYKLFDGTDLDIQSEMINAEQKIDDVFDLKIIEDQLKETMVLAKRYMLERGTMRIFNFEISKQPIQFRDKQFDGTINLVLNKTIQEKDVLEDEPILTCYLKNIQKLKEAVREIKKVNYVIANHYDDRIAIKHLNELKQGELKIINKILQNSLYAEDSRWFFNNEKVNIKSSKDLNQLVSLVSEKYYYQTPIFKNELINKDKLSPPITLARKKFIKNLCENINEENIGFEHDKFPPQKTIYETLLKSTGIHNIQNGERIQSAPIKTFEPLWNASIEFVKSSSKATKNITDFINILLSPPFGLKKSFADIWVAAFLILEQDEFAIYYQEKYIADLNYDTLELLYKVPHLFKIKSFDVKGKKLDLFNKYRELTQLDTLKNAKKTNFIQTVKPFLILGAQLPESTKNTNNLSKETILLRDAIVNATDPEKLFFESFPSAFSIYDISELSKRELYQYAENLKKSIKELTSFYNNLVQETLAQIASILGNKKDFKKVKKSVFKRYKKSIKEELLPLHIKTFYKRVVSELDDAESWVNSIVQDLVGGQTLRTISDEDYIKLKYRLEKAFLELDHLVELQKIELDSNQKAYRLQLTSEEGDRTTQFIINETENKKSEKLLDQINNKLKGQSLETKKITLIKLLKDLSKDE